MDAERKKFIEDYAKIVKSGNSWRKEQKEFLDSQINLANTFYKRLILLPGGKDKFIKVTGASKNFAEDFYNDICLNS